MDEEEFRQLLQTEGFSEPKTVDYAPNSANEMHIHDFTAHVFVLSGEFTLVTEGGEQIHQPGETCQLAGGTLHSEQAGPDGATILVGRKTAAA